MYVYLWDSGTKTICIDIIWSRIRTVCSSERRSLPGQVAYTQGCVSRKYVLKLMQNEFERTILTVRLTVQNLKQPVITQPPIWNFYCDVSHQLLLWCLKGAAHRRTNRPTHGQTGEKTSSPPPGHLCLVAIIIVLSVLLTERQSDQYSQIHSLNCIMQYFKDAQHLIQWHECRQTATLTHWYIWALWCNASWENQKPTFFSLVMKRHFLFAHMDFHGFPCIVTDKLTT